MTGCGYPPLSSFIILSGVRLEVVFTSVRFVLHAFGPERVASYLHKQIQSTVACSQLQNCDG